MGLLEYLIKILGEEKGKEVYDALSKDKDNVVIVDNKKDSKYVEKSIYDEVVKEKENLIKQNKKNEKDLNDIKNSVKDNDELKNQIDKLQNENKEAKDNYEKEIEKMKYDFALDSAIEKASAKNNKALKGLLDYEKIKLVDGKLIGIDEQIEELKKSDSYLFNSTPNGTGNLDINNGNLNINNNNSNNSFIENLINSKKAENESTSTLDNFFK